ncbi:MAG: heavy metal translocating P-type ATPase [Acidobacteria bacterium]|nr:heavy metal translocating P-type ATPase [Acidobacteriota bacterium]
MKHHAEYRIQGLDCSEEVSLLKQELGPIDGIQDLRFDVMKAKMTVEFDPRKLTDGGIRKAVARTGMKASPFAEKPAEKSWMIRNGRGLLTLISGLALLAGAIALSSSASEFIRSLLVHEHAHESFSPLSIAFFFIAMVCGMYYAAPKAWQALRHFSPEMNALVAVSIVGAMVLHEWLEGATLAFLFSLAGLLESWSMTRARNAVSKLLAVTPSEATVIHDSHDHRMPADQVKVGEMVRIRPGERVPCDGAITTGDSLVNQALITGESVPVRKAPGDTVYAGTINGDGTLEVKVSKPHEDTLLSRMLRMLEGAQHSRAQSEQFVERFSRIYTPVMFLLAMLVATIPPLFRGADWGASAYQGMVILLISCPCALVISTPVTVVAALASAARRGVLIKGGVFLEEAAKLKAVAFDKTGVLTMGQPEVQTLRTLDGLTETEALRRLVALEQRSEHPVGHAIVRYAAGRGLQGETVSDFRALQGRGAEAVIANERFWAGSHRFLHEKGLEHNWICNDVDVMEDDGHTAFLCGTEREVWAVVGLADPIRPEAAEALEGLRRNGVSRLIMVTGDNKPTATAVSRRLGIDDVRAEMLPEEKAQAVQQLRAEHGHIAMVGDGINDAQALASASVGIALGKRSTDVALETADVVLMNDDLRSLSFLLRHSRRALAVIKQNVMVALGLKAIFLVLAFGGVATLWMAIAADMGGTLLVTFNGLRLLRATR